MPKVLVTGGTGFVAGHCIKQLLERGYDVATTVRSHEKGKKVLGAHSAYADGKLSYRIVEDIASPDAFKEVADTHPDFVIHAASPFHYNVQDPVKDFLEPAVAGTTSILKFVHEHVSSVKRVVVLSSFAAMRDDSQTPPPVYDESYWNPVTWDEAVQNTRKTYQGSKTLAERAAFDFLKNKKPQFDLVTICPTLVFGPAAPSLARGELGQINTSNQRILDMIQGKMKETLAPTGFYSWVDVRDVVHAHIRALEVPEAAGRRFFLVAGHFSNKELAELVAAMSPELKAQLPAKLDEVADDLPAPDKRYGFNNKQSREVLGVEYLSLEKSVKDTVDSLLRLQD